MALETSLEKPAPVRVIANVMSGYIQRLGPVWIEGQIAQLNRRSTSSTVFLTLRDPVAEVSVQVTCARSTFDALATPVTEGARVVVFARFQYYVPRGTLSLNAREIRPVGVGELLARIEQRRQLLAAEGLFDRGRKRRLPFLPQLIGLVVGRNSAAERDVVDNARRRWPGVEFRIEYAVVQGHDAARRVIEALAVLDTDPESTSSWWRAAVGHWRTSSRSRTRGCSGQLLRVALLSSVPSVMSPTSRCSTWWPICGHPPRPTPPSWFFPTFARRHFASPG